MKTLHYIIYLNLTLLLVSACGNQNNKHRKDEINNVPTTKQQGTKTPLLGERIRGNVLLKANPNGYDIAELYDSTQVSCTPLKNGWYQVGVICSVDINKMKGGIFRKGTKLTTDNNKVIGMLLKDKSQEELFMDDHNTIQLTGYVQEKDIYKESIIENYLNEFLKDKASLVKSDFDSAFHSFDFKPFDIMSPYEGYLMYENWIEDPSPISRVLILFKDKNFVGLVHSRPIEPLSAMKDYKLERDLKLLVFEDLPKNSLKKVMDDINEFLTHSD
ncbi:hypothetical protein [Porphyromonas pogonae]|uniref:hypothetical protein n=1 Tax=Porphyromonas pogonae TaxID=867595 RepID=UPI002E772CEE|nr:hypothetical protein [Porphyromonas pogonae]